MEYNKFIYKINKYKSYLRDPKKKRKEHYQKKIDFYYKQIEQIVQNINEQKGGFTDADLMNFLEPTTNKLEEKLNQTANIKKFQDQQQKYEENHKKIITFLDNLLAHNTELDMKAKEEIDKLRDKMEKMDDKHRQEIQDKLRLIQEKVTAQKNLTLDEIKNKIKIKL